MSNKRTWTKEEILDMWPQAKGELQGFQRHLERNSGITASQLGMALQLAEIEFKRLQSKPRLRVVCKDERIATVGKFRAVVLIDSETYQVGEDVDTPEQAISLCALALQDPSPRIYQVYDDKGQKVIK